MKWNYHLLQGERYYSDDIQTIEYFIEVKNENNQVLGNAIVNNPYSRVDIANALIELGNKLKGENE